MIYFLQRRDGAIKIGFTSSNVTRRKATLEVAHGKLENLGEMDGDLSVEKSIHARFADARIDSREWFYPTDELLAYIRKETRLHKRIELERIELPELPYPTDATRRKVTTRFNDYVAAHGITLADVCDGTGLSMFTISRFARGHITRFESETLIALCRFFRCRASEFIVSVAID